MSLSIDEIIWGHYFQFLDLSVSPDDQEVLVVFGNRDMPHDSYVLDEMNRSMWKLRLSDGQASQLAPPEEDAHVPCWSPDGTQIAYLSRRSGQTEIWTMNRDGTEVRQVTHSNFPTQNPFDGSSLYWSPDGLSIAYTVVPNGGISALRAQDTSKELGESLGLDQIIVYHSMSDEERLERWNHPLPLEGAVYIIDLHSGRNRQLAFQSGEGFRIIGWFPGHDQLLVNVGSELREITVSTGEMRGLYSGPVDLVNLTMSDIRLARLSESHLEIGSVENGGYNQEYSIEVPGYETSLDAWSRDGSRLFGRTQDGVTTYLFRVPTRFYVDVFCLCCIGIVKEFIIGISNLFILIPESIPSF